MNSSQGMGFPENYGQWTVNYQLETADINNYEYCFLDNSMRELVTTPILLEKAARENNLTFISLKDGIVIDDTKYTDSQSWQGKKSAYIIARRKGTITMLPSACQPVEIYKNEVTYSASLNYNYNEDYNAGCFNQLDNISDYTIEIKRQSAVIDV